MVYFRSDYTQGAHPKVMEALQRTNLEHTDGYGLDEHCMHAAEMIRGLIGRSDCAVHMMVGGTPCNITVIAAALRPYESVVAARSGHIYSHETGAIEATGHRVVTFPGENGKLTPEMIDRAFDEYEDEHTLRPRMAYISQSTEIGSIYRKAELAALYAKCKERDMLLYVDGARLGSALTSPENDLSIRELASLCDAFYIGGTKNGALFGEALVILNPVIDDHFRYMIKRQGGMLAKGRLIGVQFEALLEGGENCVYYEMAAHANRLALKLREGLQALGIGFYSDSPTNQIFPVLPTAAVEALEKDFSFYRWAPEKDGMTPIRLVTGWGTEEADVDAFLEAVRRL
jgi:threonine aldolase